MCALEADVKRAPSPCCSTVAELPEISFDSERWPPLKAVLDELPCFTLVNGNAEPLGYERDGQAICIFFVDIGRAEQELDGMREKFPDLGLRLLSAGVGDAFERSVKGKALLVPSAAGLERAGDDWNSEMLPLFTCLAMSKPSADGSCQTVPFFMDPNDAQANLDNAVKEARESLSDQQLAALQLVCTPLSRAVQIIVAGQEVDFCQKWGTSAESFQFVPPGSSVNYLQAAVDELERRTASAAPTASTPAPRFRGSGGAPPAGLFPE